MAEGQRSGAPPAAAAATINDGRKTFFGSKKNGKWRVPDGENAPLLQEGAHRDTDTPYNQDSEGGSPSLYRRVVCFLKQPMIWALENLVIVVLACLLAAGTVAVCVYGCKSSVITNILVIMLTYHSHAPQ